MTVRPVKDANNTTDLKIDKGHFYYGWIVLAACVLILTTSYGIRYSYGVFFNSLEEEFGWTRALTSGIFSAYMLLCSLCAFLGGWASDRYGARKVVIVLGCFAFISLTLTSQANTLWHLFLSYSLLLAIGTGPVYAIVMATATKWFIRRRGLALAIVGTGVGLSTLITAPLSAYLIGSYGWRASYVILAFIALCIFIPCAVLLKRVPREVVTSNSVAKPGNSKSNYANEPKSNERREFTLLQAIKTGSLWIMFSIWFLYAACFFIITTHIVPHAIDLGFTSMLAASLLSITGLANVPGRILLGMASDRFGKKRIAVICALFMGAAMLWLTESTSLWMLYLFAAVFGTANGGLSPPLLAIVADNYGARHIGAIFGILEIGWATGAAVTPALAGYIFDITGSYYFAFLLGMLAMLIIVVLVLLQKTPAVKTGDNPAGKASY